MGVLWSNQTTKRFGFKVHVDGAAPGTWSADELPASQSADDSLGAAFGMADDHMNVKVSSNGTLYAAVKTTTTRPTTPRSRCSSADRMATWDNLYEVDNAGTRAIVLINEPANLVRVVYSSTEGFSSTVYKDSAAVLDQLWAPPDDDVRGVQRCDRQQAELDDDLRRRGKRCCQRHRWRDVQLR